MVDFVAPGPNGEILIEYRYSDLSAEVYFEYGEETELILHQGQSQKYVGELNVEKLFDHFSTVFSS